MSSFSDGPKISVLLAVHNGEKYIYDAIKSVLNQTYRNFQLLVCLNGCTDNSEKIVRELLKNTDIKTFIISIREKGKANALNTLLQWHELYSDFIAIQDADDIWLPNKLEEQVKHTDKYDVIGSKINYIDAAGDNMAMEFVTSYNDDDIKKRIYSGINPIANCTALIRRSLLKQCTGYGYLYNYYNPTWEGIEDYELWLRIIKEVPEAKFINVNQVLALHRLHKDSHFNSNIAFNGAERIKQLLKHFEIA